MTKIVLNMKEVMDIDLIRILNDSTTVKAYGKIPAKTRTGLELTHGNSKD